jgi:2,5-diketo-D-gluconate reductase A
MPDTSLVPRIALLDDRSIPQLGFGVWQVPDDIAAHVVERALRVGYRHVDTAAIYENERGVGEGLRASGIARDEVFVTTKLWNDDQGRDSTLRAFDASRERLGLDEVDLYLIHWPSPVRGEQYVESWKALGELHEQGVARSIGVSNFGADHLERAIDATGTVPVLNQVELHPYFQQRELRMTHDRLGIATEAWSPLGRGGELLDDPVIGGIARELDVTPAQVVLRWHLQRGFVVIPKSQHDERIAQNFDVFGFALEAEQLAAIDALDRGEDGRIGPDPATAGF